MFKRFLILALLVAGAVPAPAAQPSRWALFCGMLVASQRVILTRVQARDRILNFIDDTMKLPRARRMREAPIHSADHSADSARRRSVSRLAHAIHALEDGRYAGGILAFEMEGPLTIQFHGTVVAHAIQDPGQEEAVTRKTNRVIRLLAYAGLPIVHILGSLAKAGPDLSAFLNAVTAGEMLAPTVTGLAGLGFLIEHNIATDRVVASPREVGHHIRRAADHRSPLPGEWRHDSFDLFYEGMGNADIRERLATVEEKLSPGADGEAVRRFINYLRPRGYRTIRVDTLSDMTANRISVVIRTEAQYEDQID